MAADSSTNLRRHSSSDDSSDDSSDSSSDSISDSRSFIDVEGRFARSRSKSRDLSVRGGLKYL